MLLIAVRLTFRAVFAIADYTKLVLKLYVRKKRLIGKYQEKFDKKKEVKGENEVNMFR